MYSVHPRQQDQVMSAAVAEWTQGNLTTLGSGAEQGAERAREAECGQMPVVH